jgi:hypothetical protein
MSITTLVGIGGLITLLLIGTTILLGLRIIKLNFKWHKRFAFISLIFGILHGTFAFLYFMGFLSL